MARTRSASCAVGVAPDAPGLPVVGQGDLSVVRKSKRSRLRAGVLIGVHLLVAVHVTHWLVARRTLSPVEPSEAMATLELGYVNAGFVFFAVALAATAVFGRFFCGWGCHIVALQDLCGFIMKKFGVRPRPFRSRFLAFAPLAAAFYMFAWPTIARLFAGAPRPSGWSNHLLTNDLWATFPGPVFTLLTFAACGFAAVYFLGAKGFCTYGCPYGALFAGLDRVSPGRIVVNDDCEQCGHCTVTCTSNVRVHEEVRLFGAVVDPGCMKCMDCVSVCPKHALRFAFAKPALFERRPRRYDLALGEEILVASVGLAATLAFRDLYNGPPLLLSIGLGAITAFVALKLFRLVRKSDVRIQNLVLRSGGRVTRSGRAFAFLSALWLAFAAHSAFVQWHRAWGRHWLDRTEVSRAEGLSGAFRDRPQSEGHRRALEEAYRHFSLADRWGIAGVVEVKLGLAWCDVLRSDPAAAAREAREALALSPEKPELRRNLFDLEDAAAAELARSGDLEGAAERYRACVALSPDSASARYNLGGVLRRLGREEAAIDELIEARRLAPEDYDVRVELGLACMAAGRKEEAIESFRKAMELDPDRPESRLHLPGLLRELEGERP